MDRGLTTYPPATTSRSQLLTSPPQPVPSLEELLSLESELKSIQSKTVARVKKALVDMLTVDTIYKQAKQRDGKSKVKKASAVKFKREFSSTPDIEMSPPADPAWAPPASRAVALQESNSLPSLPRSSKSSRPSHDKKKKRKREAFESDMEGIEIESQTRSRTSTNMSPPPIIIPHAKHREREKDHHKEKEHKDRDHHKDKKKKLNIDLDDGPPVRLNAAGFRVADNFSLPPRPSIPSRPIHNPPPPPGITDPEQVTEDFSGRRQPSNQVPITQYWNYVEPFIRPLREEDVAFLEFNGDDVEPFLIPALGRHYQEVWDDEDLLLEATYGRGDAMSSRSESVPLSNPYSSSVNGSSSTFASASTAITTPNPFSGSSSSNGKPLPNSAANWNPSTLTEADCITDERSYGPLTERLLGAFLLEENMTGKLCDLVEGPMSGYGGGLGGGGKNGTNGGVSNKDSGVSGLRVGDLEDRIAAEMRSLGLLPEGQTPDLSQDDEIVSELRRTQRLLMAQCKINAERKARLSAIAQSRLQYSDYMEYRDGLARKLSSAFGKLSRVGVGRIGKNRKKKGDREREREMLKAVDEAKIWSETKYGPNGSHHVHGESPPPPGSIGPTGIPGMGMVGVSGKLEVPDEIVEDVELRKEWIRVVGEMLEEVERQHPGRIRGTPMASIYEGIESEDGVLAERAVLSIPSTAGDNAVA